MTNIIPFRKSKDRHKADRHKADRPRSYPVVTTVIDPDVPPRSGDTVAFCWFREDGTPGEVMISRYWGPTGRDAKGRFVKAGSEHEEHAFDHFTYRPGDDQHYRILGKVVVSGWSHDVAL